MHDASFGPDGAAARAPQRMAADFANGSASTLNVGQRAL
jgi:hypothetical protein